MAARKPAAKHDEFASEAPPEGAGLVLADNVHYLGEVFLKGSAVTDLPAALRTHVVRNPTLAVKPE